MRKTEVFFRSGWLAAVAAGLMLSVAGCGSADNTVASKAASARAAKKAKKSVVTPGELDLASMVAAVSSSKGGPPVELKFDLPVRPEVGQVTDIDIAVIPRAPVPDSVAVSFQVEDGLDIVEGAQLDRVEKLVDGTPIRHVVKIRPKRDGIFALTAAVTFVQANQDWMRTFSIPLIAGEGLPEQVAKGP